MRRIIALAVFGLLVATPAARAAKPQAPGAPGAIHTWAPADKHGYGTSARGTADPAAFTLRQAMLTEVYWPDLSTPSFRGLQFAVVDGSRVTRETVDDDPRHIEPVAPGVRARVHAIDGTLSYRQVTRTNRWRLTKTWITDPSRATVLARVRFRALKGSPRLYVLADPAPGDDGNDDQGTSTPSTLLASDDAGATVVAAKPPLSETSSGYRGSASDPWQDLQDDGRRSGRAHRPRRPQAQAHDTGDRVRPRRRERRRECRGLAGRRVRRGPDRVQRRLGGLPDDAEAPAAVGRGHAAAV
jgi:glucoamylase